MQAIECIANCNYDIISFGQNANTRWIHCTTCAHTDDHIVQWRVCVQFVANEICMFINNSTNVLFLSTSAQIAVELGLGVCVFVCIPGSKCSFC